MSGTTQGGVKAGRTNKLKYGEDFYKKMGAKGGKLGRTGGFASSRVGPDGLTGKERAAVAGQKGGRKSRRTGVYKVGPKTEPTLDDLLHYEKPENPLKRLFRRK